MPFRVGGQPGAAASSGTAPMPRSGAPAPPRPPPVRPQPTQPTPAPPMQRLPGTSSSTPIDLGSPARPQARGTADSAPIVLDGSDSDDSLQPPPQRRRTSLSASKESLSAVALVTGTLCLEPEQKQVLQLAASGANLFITGGPGTGKTFTIDLLRKLYENLRIEVFITASTATAACGVGGVTVHHFSGIQLANGAAEQVIDTVLNNVDACNRWRSTRALRTRARCFDAAQCASW